MRWVTCLTATVKLGLVCGYCKEQKCNKDTLVQLLLGLYLSLIYIAKPFTSYRLYKPLAIKAEYNKSAVAVKLAY